MIRGALLELLCVVAMIGIPSFVAYMSTPRTPDRRRMPR